jgi:glycosyltransferase involved in cell wall biosynthesis
MNNPLISIIIPTYNRAWCINRAIDSCLAQTYKNFEIVITDDGSDDNTSEIIKEYNNDNIRYFQFKQNQGVIKARNNSIINSKGEWILLFDSDDELYPNCLEVFIENINKLDNNKIKMIFAHFTSTATGKTKISDKFQQILEQQNNILTYHNFICAGVAIGDPLPIVKKEIFDKVPYDTHVKRNMAVVWHQFFKISDVLVIDDYLGTCYVDGDDRITANRGRDSKLWIEGLEEYIRIFKNDILNNCPKAISIHYRSLAIYQYQANQIKESRISFLKALKYNMLDYKSWIYFVSSFNKIIMNKLLDK